jgi:hypothetical protein
LASVVVVAGRVVVVAGTVVVVTGTVVVVEAGPVPVVVEVVGLDDGVNTVSEVGPWGELTGGPLT